MNYQLLFLFVLFIAIRIHFIDCYESGFTLSSNDVNELLTKVRVKRSLPYHQKSKSNKVITTTWKFIPADDVDKKTTKSSKDVQSLVSTKMPSIDYISPSDSWDTNPDLNSLWAYRPASLQSNPSDISRHVVFKPPHLLTRLTKPLTFGFDPFFNKGYFEPFESRQKPVTLVTFRKNGLVPRQTIKEEEKKLASDEVAEMQSPFNDISGFWDDVPGLFNI